MAVDNIVLSILSIKQAIEKHLDLQSTGWKNKYKVFLAEDPALKNKEYVLKATPRDRDQIELPVILISTGPVRNQTIQLGDQFGSDFQTLTLFVMCKDNIQLLSLANLVRRYMNDRTVTVFNYTGSRQESVGTVELTRTTFTNLSLPNSDNIAERYYGIINSTLEVSAESFL